MAEIKLTKNELRDQQQRLHQLEKYLPTLQLKKAMLQLEVNEAKQEVQRLEAAFQKQERVVDAFSTLLSHEFGFSLQSTVAVKSVRVRHENIAGVEVPYFEKVDFEEITYTLFDTPPWLDAVVCDLRQLISAEKEIFVAVQKQTALEHELREVSIRVNLFEKVLIPRARGNIKKIKVFLGDQQLNAVAQAKVAKAKLLHVVEVT